MRSVVKITRRGQTTIPLEIRKKLGIAEGDWLAVEATEKGILLKVIPRLEELAGVDAKYGEAEEVKREIERMREEY